MEDPIELNLKTQKQIALARLQDKAVEAIFEVNSKIIMHGGTAIWRCYKGNRFSEDIDIYATDQQMKTLLKFLTWSFSKRNIKLEYPKFNPRTIKFSDNFANSKIEAMKPKLIKPIQKEYTRSNGTKFVIRTLSANDFILEKINTYKKRFYIRDLYDIYHLVNTENINQNTKKQIKKFITNIKKPIDEKNLKELIYIGIAPTFETMVNSIKTRLI